MPKKGIRSLFSLSHLHHHLHHHHHTHAPSTAAPLPPHRTTFSVSLMEENISTAEAIITKWDPQASDHAKHTSLFPENRDDARLFLRAVADLQRAMHFFIEDSPVSSAPSLAHAQSLMQTAMKRLEKEFSQLLSTTRDSLDSASVSGGSVSARSSLASFNSNSSDNDAVSTLSELEEDGSDESRAGGDSVREAMESAPSDAMADLRSIAECMISSGYGRECVKIYKTVRRSIVDEGLHKLGFEKLTHTQVHKMDWDVLELRLKSWLRVTRIAVGTLFAGERVLCDYVFTTADSIRQACFADIARDPAVELLAFPELVIRAKHSHSPERMFRVLDLYESLTELWPDIEYIFSYDSTSAVRSQGLSSLLKFREAVRSILADFEAAIQKDALKTAIPGGGLHPLTRYVMNYVSFLADYSGVLAEIFADYPLPAHTSLRESSAADSSSHGQAWSSSSSSASGSTMSSPSSSLEEYSPSSISVRLAWLILMLLCKLDGKTEIYRGEVALSYLFLGNNLEYIVKKVRRSKLSHLLGEEWVARHEDKARLYTGKFERLGWGKVLAAIPEDLEDVAEAGAAREHMRRFNEAFDEACRAQAGFVVVDGRMREEVKASIVRQIVPAYRPFYERCRLLTAVGDDSVAVVRFTPEDLRNSISDMYYGPDPSGSDSTGSGSSKRSPRPT